MAAAPLRIQSENGASGTAAEKGLAEAKLVVYQVVSSLLGAAQVLNLLLDCGLSLLSDLSLWPMCGFDSSFAKQLVQLRRAEDK